MATILDRSVVDHPFDTTSSIHHTDLQGLGLRHVRDQSPHDPGIRAVHPTAALLDLGVGEDQPARAARRGEPAVVPSVTHCARHAATRLPQLELGKMGPVDLTRRVPLCARNPGGAHVTQLRHRADPHRRLVAVQHGGAGIQHHLVADLPRRRQGLLLPRQQGVVGDCGVELSHLHLRQGLLCPQEQST